MFNENLIILTLNPLPHFIFHNILILFLVKAAVNVIPSYPQLKSCMSDSYQYCFNNYPSINQEDFYLKKFNSLVCLFVSFQ